MSTTFKTKNAGTKVSASEKARIVPSGVNDCEEFISALGDLKQPWNWVVRAFIRLLQEPNAKHRWAPQLLHYFYAQTPLNDGRWFMPGSTAAQHGPVPLGIVCNNTFEVAIRDEWKQGNERKLRLIPVAMLGPGALFGAFEFCDLRACVPSLRNYEVSAGSRAFKIVPKKGDSIRIPSGAFCSFLKESNRCQDWREGRAEHDELVRYYQLASSWTATMLVLSQTPPNLTPRERGLLDVVQNEAWRQSRHLREGHLKWLRHDLDLKDLTIPKPLSIAIVSKFKRKVELALSEECLVFGNPAKLEEYGPCSALIKKINGSINNRELQETDVLAPLLLHDTGSPSYLSLTDEASVFGTSGDYTQIRKVTGDIIKAVKDANPSCHIAEATVKAGRADEFWRGAVELKPRFAELPCLDSICRQVTGNPFAGCAVVAAQHLLEETGSLLQAIIRIQLAEASRQLATLDPQTHASQHKELAAKIENLPKHVFVIGKPYSSNVRVWQRLSNLGVSIDRLFFDWNLGEFEEAYREACRALWSKVEEHLAQNTDLTRILILDDGGMLLATIPSNLTDTHAIVGVEQTSKGLNIATKCVFPVVGVACSAAKRRLEPSIVAETVWQKLEMILPQACAARTMAICGLGNVGDRLAEFIIERFLLRDSDKIQAGRRLLIFDKNKKLMDGFDVKGSVIRANSLPEVFEQSEVIFGCTGTDLTKDIVNRLDAIADCKTRYLVSCSSIDIEFATLLKQSERNPNLSPFDLAQYVNRHATPFLIPQAGFPITFDRAPSSAPIEQMQMTRGLLLAGLIQAASLAATERRPNGIVALDAQMQIAIVKAWRDAKARSENWFFECWYGKRDELVKVQEESRPPKASNDTQFLRR